MSSIGISSFGFWSCLPGKPGWGVSHFPFWLHCDPLTSDLPERSLTCVPASPWSLCIEHVQVGCATTTGASSSSGFCSVLELSCSMRLDSCGWQACVVDLVSFYKCMWLSFHHVVCFSWKFLSDYRHLVSQGILMVQWRMTVSFFFYFFYCGKIHRVYHLNHF